MLAKETKLGLRPAVAFMCPTLSYPFELCLGPNNNFNGYKLQAENLWNTDGNGFNN